jgi:hypothetical protein
MKKWHDSKYSFVDAGTSADEICFRRVHSTLWITLVFHVSREKPFDSWSSKSLCVRGFQVLKYFDYFFTTVFTIEITIKVSVRSVITCKSTEPVDILWPFCFFHLLSLFYLFFSCCISEYSCGFLFLWQKY